MNKFIIFAFALILVILMSLVPVAFGDYEEAQSEHNRYCYMVEKGHWGDYKGTFSEYCEPQQ